MPLAAESAPACSQLLTADLVREPETIERLTVVAYNLLNLPWHVGSPHLMQMGLIRPREGWSDNIPDEMRVEQGRIIESLGTDIAIFSELEGKAALDAFNQRFLDRRYMSFLEPGNDQRGIQVGFLAKRDLPFNVELRSHKHLTWIDPTTGLETPVFSRDLPALILRLPDETRPFLIVLGTHYKSKRERPGDPESRLWRKAQVDATVTVVQGLWREVGNDVPIVLGGDLNGDLHSEAEFASLKAALALEDAFDVIFPPLSPWDRVTHTYHRGPEGTQFRQLDALLVSPNLKRCVHDSWVYRYRDRWGGLKPLPQSIRERKRNPSDHFPVVLQLDFPCLMELWNARRRSAPRSAGEPASPPRVPRRWRGES